MISTTSDNRVSVSRADLRALRLPWKYLLANKGREYLAKVRGERFSGAGLIGAPPAVVTAGFQELTEEGFSEYNLPQVWVERRQIPRALHNRVPVHHATLLDLGCGPGSSTHVLCYFGNPSWTIIGFDMTARSIEVARRRSALGQFHNRSGEVLRPEFYCQNIAEPLMRGDRPVESASVDFAISGGVVGLYLQTEDVTRLARELRRVTKAGGFIALDSGPAVPAGTLKSVVENEGFVLVDVCKSFWIEPRPKLVFRA